VIGLRVDGWKPARWPQAILGEAGETCMSLEQSEGSGHRGVPNRVHTHRVRTLAPCVAFVDSRHGKQPIRDADIPAAQRRRLASGRQRRAGGAAGNL
jgi:hypothetical protein